MAELKPCPFCGSEADTAYNTRFNYQVFCTNDECFMSTITMYEMATEAEAVTAWNRRSEPTQGETTKGIARFMAKTDWNRRADNG